MCISFHNTTYTSRNLDFFHCYYTFLHNNFNIYFLSFFPFSTFHLGDVVNAYLGGGSLVAKSCLILCDPMDCSPPVSSVHGVSQARILEWGATSFSRGSSSQPSNRSRCRQIVYRLNPWEAVRCFYILLYII